MAEMAIAAQTRRIRLGQATNILSGTTRCGWPSRSRMLDVISGGRVEFGVGRGYQPREVEVLGFPYGSSIQDQERNRAYFQEAYHHHHQGLDRAVLFAPRPVLHRAADLHQLEP